MELGHTLQFVGNMFDWHDILHYQDHMMAHSMADQLVHAIYTVFLFCSSSSHKLSDYDTTQTHFAVCYTSFIKIAAIAILCGSYICD